MDFGFLVLILMVWLFSLRMLVRKICSDMEKFLTFYLPKLVWQGLRLKLLKGLIGKQDLLLNNAIWSGPGLLDPIENLSLEILEKAFMANTFNQLYLTQLVLPHMHVSCVQQPNNPMAAITETTADERASGDGEVVGAVADGLADAASLPEAMAALLRPLSLPIPKPADKARKGRETDADLVEDE